MRPAAPPFVFALALAALLLAGAPAPARAAEGARADLRFGLNAFRDGFYAPAAEALARYVKAGPKGEEAAAARYFLAEAMRRAGREREALAAFRAFLARHAKDARADEARFRLGELYERAGEAAAAASAYAGVGPGPFRVEAAHRIAALRVRAGAWAPAAEALARFVALAPGDPRVPDALYERAAALDRLGRRTEAEAAYRRALERAPKSPRARIARRRLGLIQLALRRYGPAEATLEALVRLAPAEGRRPEVRLAYAGALFGRGRFARAADAYEAALGLSLTEAQRRAAERGAAAALWRAGSFDRAARAYRRLVRERAKDAPAPGSPGASPVRGDPALGRMIESLHRSGGCVWARREDLRFALGALEKGAELPLGGRFLLADCLKNAGLEKEALERFAAIARSAPDEKEGLWAELRLGEAADAAGRREEAAGRYERVLRAVAARRADPEKADPRLASAAFAGGLRAASIHFAKEDCPAALRLVKAVPREAVPEAARAEVVSIRAECALRAKRYDEAEVYFGEVLLGGRRPELAARARFQLARIAEARGDKAEALRRLRDAIPLLPKGPAREARLRAGRLLLERGEGAAARAMLLPFAADAGADPDRRRAVWLLLAREAAAAGRWDEAEGDLQRWEALAPPHPLDGLRLRAAARFRAGRCPGAVEAARAALAEDPAADARLELHRLIASCRLRADAPAEAVPSLREVVRLDPADAGAAFDLAAALGRAGAKPEAAEAYAAFLRRFPRHARSGGAALRLGFLRAGAGDAEGALRAFRTAARAGGEAADAARYEIARAMEGRGAREEALAAFEALAAGDPPASKWRRAALWRAAALRERRGEWEKALAHYRRLAGAAAGEKGEARQAEARARRLEAYLRAVREREEKMRRQEPLVR